MATSGETKIELAPSFRLCSIRNRGSPRGSSDDQRTSSIRASGGGLEVSSPKKRSRESDSPSTSIKTPPDSFLHKANETEPIRKIVDERTKSDSLNDAAHGNRATVHEASLVM